MTLERRILRALFEAGALPGRRRVNSWRLVRAVSGRERRDAVYDALVRLARDFVTRYPLVDGAGNFGSIDNDPAADMEYTEARLSPLGAEIVTAGGVPERMLNGGDGVPPHNLREVAAAVAAFLADPGISAEALAAHLPGPDFPTGGIVVAAVRGRLRVRARTHFEESAIIVTELPYGVLKGGDGGVILELAELHNARVIELRNLLDESVGSGMRIVIQHTADDPERLLAALFAHTRLEVAIPAGPSPHDLVAGFVAGEREAGAGDETIRRRVAELADRHGDARRTALPAF